MDKLIAGAEKLGFHLIPLQVEQFEIYYRELIQWNKRVNLTAIVDYEEVQIKHFLDSLTVALALEVGTQTDASFHVIDIGTGAGMPGVPFKILFPDVRLVLLDSVGKKTSFLNHLVAKLGLSGVEVLTARAEDLAREEQHREIYDLVLSRAVAELPTLVELTLPFCRIGGIFVAQKKGLIIEEEIKRAQKAIELLGGRLREVKEIKVNGLLEEQLLIIIEKIAPTVSHYPRRAGIPTKRPL